MKRGLVFVISAPAGTGKTTLVKMLKDEFHNVVDSISFTTRPPRPNEVEGRDYNFIAKKEFEHKIKAGEFLEYAEVFHNYYGTSRKYVEAQQEKGKHVIMVIDTQGAMQLMGIPCAVRNGVFDKAGALRLQQRSDAEAGHVRDMAAGVPGDASSLGKGAGGCKDGDASEVKNVISDRARYKFDAIYIFISPPSLEELMARLYRRKSEDEEAIRTRLSWAEKEMALAPKYNYHIVNDNLKVAYDALRSILIAEEHKNR